MGLWSLGDLNPIHEVETGYDEVSSHFNAANGLRAVADYGSGIANFVTSTVTLNHVHVSAPFCGFGWASDVGYGYGLAATALLTGGAGEGADAADATADAATDVTENTASIPTRLARVVQAKFANSPTIGAPGASRVFVTAADDIDGITSSQELADRLTLVDSSGKAVQGPFAVTTFDTPSEGLGVPVFRSNPGFVQGGYTQGGAREFDLPNMLYSTLSNVQQEIVP
jgi:hypothetical protein